MAHGLHVRMRPSPILNKLMTLAEGDFELVNKAIRSSQQYRRWRWWQRKRVAADLKKVVEFIVEAKRLKPCRT